MDEVWKPIRGFEGLYEISNLGRVKSLNYRNLGFPRVLVAKENNKGYLWVELWKDGKGHCLQIHRLVGIHFIPNDSRNRTIINHIDEDPKNNVVTNLEWCTAKENSEAYYLNHPQKLTRTNHKSSERYVNRTAEQVVQLTKDDSVIETHENIGSVIRKFKYNYTSIYECCIGKRKTAYGCKWQFASQVAST